MLFADLSICRFVRGALAVDADHFYIVEDGEVELNAGRRTVSLRVANTGDRPVQVGSHAHFFEVNRYLHFERWLAFGMRLDIPAGTATRFEPGDEKDVTLVAFAGNGIATGMSAIVQGTTTADGALETAMQRAKEEGFV